MASMEFGGFSSYMIAASHTTRHLYKYQSIHQYSFTLSLGNDNIDTSLASIVRARLTCITSPAYFCFGCWEPVKRQAGASKAVSRALAGEAEDRALLDTSNFRTTIRV